MDEAEKIVEKISFWNSLPFKGGIIEIVCRSKVGSSIGRLSSKGRIFSWKFTIKNRIFNRNSLPCKGWVIGIYYRSKVGSSIGIVNRPKLGLLEQLTFQRKNL